MLDYQSAGVNIDAGNQLVEKIKPLTQKTMRKEVMGGIGGFGALFELDTSKFQQPVLVSATDGVGTKLLLANQMQQHDTIGIDLVAMCVNDLITMGAEPLFFLDYFATGVLSVTTATEIISGIATGCMQAGAALVGGETAEMPGMYSAEDYDLAGFCVGAVEKSNIISGKKVNAGDKLIALASTGPHANGYSLIRKILEQNHIALKDPFKETSQTVGEVLLTPTKIYVKAILELIKHVEVKAIAHITGGGLIENLPRVLPNNVRAIIHRESWQWPDVFTWLQTRGNIATSEMLRTFNCGVGMVVCVDADNTQACLENLKLSEQAAWVIGEIAESDQPESHVDWV